MQYKLKKIATIVHGTDMMAGANRPDFRVTDDQIAEIKDWEVGEKYQLVIEVEMISKTKIGILGGTDDYDGRFEVQAYKHLAPKSLDEMTDEEFELEQAKGLSSKK